MLHSFAQAAACLWAAAQQRTHAGSPTVCAGTAVPHRWASRAFVPASLDLWACPACAITCTGPQKHASARTGQPAHAHAARTLHGGGSPHRPAAPHTCSTPLSSHPSTTRPGCARQSSNAPPSVLLHTHTLQSSLSARLLPVGQGATRCATERHLPRMPVERAKPPTGLPASCRAPVAAQRTDWGENRFCSSNSSSGGSSRGVRRWPNQPPVLKRVPGRWAVLCWCPREWVMRERREQRGAGGFCNKVMSAWPIGGTHSAPFADLLRQSEGAGLHGVLKGVNAQEHRRGHMRIHAAGETGKQGEGCRLGPVQCGARHTAGGINEVGKEGHASRQGPA